jgi:spermidine/putrescine transport system substrate-binding protein
MRWLALIALLSLFLTTFSCNSPPKEKLYLFVWSDMFAPELIEQFEQEYNCDVYVTLYDSNESMFAKLKLGATGYDLIFPSCYFLDILAQQQMIAPLDAAKIPNLALMDPHYYTPSEPLWGVPFLVSFSGIAYRQDRLSEIDPSWNVFSRTDLKGRMTLLNDMRDLLGAALKVHGHSINSRDPVAIQQAADQIITWKQNIAKFESEQYKSGIASAEFLIVQGHSLDIAQVRKENSNVVFIYPKEGATLSIDYVAMPKGAQNRELAHAFINFLLAPQNAAQNMSHIYALVPILPAYDLLDPAIRADPLLFPSQEDQDKMELIKDVGQDILHYYKAWDRAKSE